MYIGTLHGIVLYRRSTDDGQTLSRAWEQARAARARSARAKKERGSQQWLYDDIVIFPPHKTVNLGINSKPPYTRKMYWSISRLLTNLPRVSHYYTVSSRSSSAVCGQRARVAGIVARREPRTPCDHESPLSPLRSVFCSTIQSKFPTN